MNNNMNENVKNDMEEPMDENMVERANAPRDTWGTGQVTGGKLYCRKQPQAGAAYWGRFDNNAIIPIKAYDSTWYETYWNGNTANVGYVKSQYITNESWNGTGGSITINRNMYCNVAEGEYVNIRSGPGTNYSSIGQLRRGDMVYVVSADTTWARINAPINGYVKRSYLQDDNVTGGGNYAHPQTQDQAFGASGIIQQGHFGYKVANVQLALGFPESEIDAIFGNNTHNAVVAFQSAHGLDPDGKVGPATKAALWSVASTTLRNHGYTTW